MLGGLNIHQLKWWILLSAARHNISLIINVKIIVLFSTTLRQFLLLNDVLKHNLCFEQ